MSNPAARWQTWKGLAPDKEATPIEILHKGENITSAKRIADKYAKFLEEKVKTIRREVKFENFKAINTFKKVIKRVDEDVEFAPTTIKEVKEIIREMKSSNARGNTDITSKILKSLIGYMGVALAHLINWILKTGIFPSKLKTARVLPLRKAGKSSGEFNLFRPINNLCPLSKVCEEVIRRRIETHLISKKVFPSNNHGARAGHSTITAIQDIELAIKCNKSNNRTSAIIATDLTSAYDIIDHAILLKNSSILVSGGFLTKS